LNKSTKKNNAIYLLIGSVVHKPLPRYFVLIHFLLFHYIFPIELFASKYVNESNGILYYGGDAQVTVFLHDDGFSYHFNHAKENEIKIRFTNANRSNISIEEVLNTENQSKDLLYFINSSSKKFIDRIIYSEIYPNIDFQIYFSGNGLKYDFIVKPGGDPKDILLTYSGFQHFEYDGGGIVFECIYGKINELQPFSYINNKNEQIEVESAYSFSNSQLSYQIGKYDLSSTLVIDPEVVWSTYYGGSDLDEGLSVTQDGNGNVFLAGITNSANNISTPGSYKPSWNQTQEVFIAKFNANGVRQWATYFGGEGEENL